MIVSPPYIILEPLKSVILAAHLAELARKMKGRRNNKPAKKKNGGKRRKGWCHE